MSPIFPNVRRKLYPYPNEPCVPADDQVIGSMLAPPPNNIDPSLFPNMESPVCGLTRAPGDLEFWHYIEPNSHVEHEQDLDSLMVCPPPCPQFQSLPKKFGTWGEWGNTSHGSNKPLYPPQSPNIFIEILCPSYNEAAKNLILEDEHFPRDLHGFGTNVLPPAFNEFRYVNHVSVGNQPSVSRDTDIIISSYNEGESYCFDPIEICNVVIYLRL